MSPSLAELRNEDSVRSERKQPPFVLAAYYGGTMKVSFEGEKYEDIVQQMISAVDEFNEEVTGGEHPDAVSAPAEGPKRRGRRPKLSALAQTPRRAGAH